MKKSRGYRSRTRRLLSKKPRERGKINISRILHKYSPREKVCIKIDSGIHKGMPHRRYHGKIGVVKEKRGSNYIVEVGRRNVTKLLIIRPEHLKPHEE